MSVNPVSQTLPILPKLSDFYVDEVIKAALKEDINYIDVTTDLLIPPESQSTAVMTAKSDGVLSGIEVALRVFGLLDKDAVVTFSLNDGSPLRKGVKIAEITGNTASLLKAERTALNLLQHMSGIATYTSLCVNAVNGTGVVIADTRKTLPGLRVLQKYAVLCGGGSNHRFNLSSAAMIKDNHIDACGSITEAVTTLRKQAGHMVMTEVEVNSFERLREAVAVGADIIMLDNMTVEMMREAVGIVAGLTDSAKTSQNRPLLEASGNVTLDNIREVADTGVDIISIGALTHSVAVVDVGLNLSAV